ncbi:MAG: polymerase III, subunit alpha protein [Candidatus Azambacteria bacterium GW2011_GWA2_42_9]|uniref:Polymerase III, subunit alpha protein n=1 Tax=Candidatus Azambacteria bacterium GW2011_GWA2_42_9 TaxID=1618613 RepID=A0A0G1BPV9_9BACT|nr:MAG: polymerase III, subunit alpha protein [Candidatus Azambacteria bacterium GW2011_GWA2_42_9]
MKFTHLHVHSHYSLLDGLIKIDDLVAKTKELGMDSIALTDHGAIYGAVEFFQKAKKAGIKPIIGCEVYVASESMADKNPGTGNKRFHLTLLVKNKIGYKNLVQLITRANLDGFYYKPRVDKNLLRRHAEGLICMSGCHQAEK